MRSNMTASGGIDSAGSFVRPILWRALAPVCLAAAFALLFSVPVQARPRDEAMAGAYHCAAISDSRRWLDCYYGAAQPVRGALGLKPAPAAQTSLVSAPVAGASAPPGDIGVRNAVMSAAAGCGGLPDERGWLDCYYTAAQPLRATLHLSPAPQAMTVPQPMAAPVRQPGAVRPMPVSGDGVPFQSRMTAYSFDKYGFFTVTLANGQVWRQVDGDTDYAHWRKPAATYLVHVTSGFLKSTNFAVKGLPGLYKVRRIS
jgi:hypothetical protein